MRFWALPTVLFSVLAAGPLFAAVLQDLSRPIMACPDRPVTVTGHSGSSTAHVGPENDAAHVCLVNATNARGEPEPQRLLFQVFQLNYRPDETAGEREARENAIRAGLSRFVLHNGAAETSFQYSERSDSGSINTYRETWRFLGEGTLLVGGAARAVLLVERQRDQIFENGSRSVWHYKIDRQTNAVVRVLVELDAGPGRAMANANTVAKEVRLP